MKSLKLSLALFLAVSMAFTSCDKDDSSPKKNTVKLGAQENTTIGGFYSFSEKKVYTMELASANQAKIDLLCFYEEGNDIALASPGSNITGIFTGDYSVELWETKNTTRFCLSALTVAEFDAIKDGDATIETQFNTEENFRKAKLLKVGDIYAFQTQDARFGLLKVTAVTQGATGTLEFEYKIK